MGDLAGNVSLLQYLLVAVVAFAASVVGGVAGYGTGLLLPPVLIPLIGAEAVVPVIGLSALVINASRVHVYREHLDLRRGALVVLCAAPFTAFSAYGYTLLGGAGATILIGIVLLVLVPARRILTRRHGHLGRRGLMLASGAYGVLVGGTAGSGVMLISILLASGLSSLGVIATDAAISLPVGIVKTAVFVWRGALPAPAWVMAAVIGFCAVPGAYVAKRLTDRLSLRAHAWILDGAVIFGGVLLLWYGIVAR